MDERKQRRILGDPNFQKLCGQKIRFGVFLTVVIVIFSMGLLIMMPLAPELLGRPLFGLRTLSIGIVWGSVLIISAIAVTGIYVWFANVRLRPLEESVLKALADED